VQGPPTVPEHGVELRSAPNQPGLNQAPAPRLTRQQLLQHTSQLVGFGGMQPTGSGRLSHQSSEPLSHQSSLPLSHQGSGQLRQHPSRQLPVQLHQQMPAQLPQLMGQAQMSHHASGQLSQQSSGQLSQHVSGQLGQYPSSQMPARQGSAPVGTGLITQGLRGSQIALELEAADRAQQQAASAAGLTGATSVMTQSTGLTIPAPSSMPGIGLPYQASGPPQQGPALSAGLPNQTMPPGMAHQAPVPGQPMAAVQQHVPAPDMGHVHRAHQLYGTNGHHGQQHPQGAQMPAAGMQAVQQQQQQQGSSGTHMQTASMPGAMQVDVGSSDGNVSPLLSPTIGLKLGQAHSPGLSEDALGGDQEFMDAMQAISGRCCCVDLVLPSSRLFAAATAACKRHCNACLRSLSQT